MFGFSKRGHRCGEEHHEGQRHCSDRMHRGGRHHMAVEAIEAARGGRRGRGEKMHRLFEHGDLRVVLLALLDKK
ncbi:PadR family transcriptional regulator, partial [Yersinia enterocolitica]